MRKIFFFLFSLTLLFGGGAKAALVDNGDGTVSDTETGLMWQKETAPGSYTWQGGLSYCEHLILAGHSDWRLPNRNELQTLVDYSRYGPAIDPLLKANTVSSYYWSSTPYAYYTGMVWRVDFYGGGVYNNDKSNSYYVRAVRAGQSGPLDNFVISDISPLQAVGVPFSVTITAVDANGN